MAFPYTATYGDNTPYVSLALGALAVPVANQSELDSKITALAPGQRLVLGAGSYTNLTVTAKNGTAASPISIVAQSAGGPKFSGNAVIKDCSYLTVSGLSWPQDTPGDTFQFRGGSHHCRAIRNTIGPAAHPGSALTGEAGSYMFVGDDCHTIDIGYNELRNKARAGNGIRVYGNFTTYVGCKRVRIHHNDIHDFYPAAVNDFEPIRYGVSTMSRTDTYGVIERNVLTNIRSEPELISVKMGAIRMTGNIARACSGNMVIRHGRNCIDADNYTIDRLNTTNTNGEGSGGHRFYDSGHLVERNYVDGTVGTNFQDPLIIDTGDAEGSSTNLSAHWRVIGATVQGNVIINCPQGITIGDNYSSAPSQITVRDNVACGVTSGVAITQRIAPVSSTLTNNLYYSTPAGGGFIQDNDTIWRKPGVGPRLTYLARSAVGPAGDPSETDGTGVVIGSGGTGPVGPGVPSVSAGPDVSAGPGTNVNIVATESNLGSVTSRKWELISTGATIDATQAAQKFAWGTPLATWSDEFNYTGAPDSTKWSMYNGPGHSGNGRRVPARGTVDGTKFVGTGLNNGDSFGMAHKFDQQYGKWEARMRCFETGTVIAGARYHVVLIIWPESGQWPEDGEYDFVELSIPGQSDLVAFIHFPHDANVSVQQRQFTRAGVGTQNWHNYAIEWTPDFIAGYVDGVEWFRTSGGATSVRRDIQTMPSGHLTVQLDNFDGTNQTPASMEVDWVRIYPRVPQGPTGGTGTTTTQIGTGQTLNWTAPNTVGAYTLRYTATAATGTYTDDTVVTVSAAQRQTIFPAGIPSEEAFGGSTMFFTGTTRPALTYPGALTFPGARTFPGIASTTGGGTDPGGGTGGGGATPPGQSFSPTGIPSAEAFGASTAFFTGIPPLTFIPDGIPSGEAFGATTTFTVGNEPPAAPGGVFVPSLWAVDKVTGALVPLPKWSKITIQRVRHALGAITIEYPSGAEGFSTLTGGVTANPARALEIRVWLGGNATKALGGWLVAKETSNRLVSGATWTFTGHFQEWLLTKAVVAPQDKNAANPKGELVFGGVTFGQVLLTAVAQAQARKALPYVTCDFTASKDSNGNAWSSVVTNLRFSPKTTIMQIADKCVELGMGEYVMTGARVLRAFNVDTRGVDRTTGASPLVFAQSINLRTQSQRESAREAGTAALVAGSEGNYAWGTNLTAEAAMGFRTEVGVDAGNITTQAGVDIYAANQATMLGKGVAEYTSGIVFRPGEPLPLINYDVSDVAAASVGNKWISSRIEQIDLTFAPREAASGIVAQNSLVIDKLSALYRKLNALANGDAVVGTSTATPGGSSDVMPPAAPTGLVVSSNIARSLPGQADVEALVTVGWLPVTTNAYIDAATAGKSQAAQLIATRLGSGSSIFEDWTWTGAPDIVGTYNDPLLLEWSTDPTNPGGPGNTVGAAARTWLVGYAAAHAGSGAVTDDVAHYIVQYSYPGGVLTGYGYVTESINIRGPLNPELAWGDAPGSPTSDTSLAFGPLVGGREAQVRVAAVDTSGNQGPWSAVLGFITAVDDQPPPVASTPEVSAFFRTMNVTWDGKGALGEDLIEAAPDVLSGGGVEVHVSTTFNFVPHRPTTVTGTLDLASSTTYQQTLYGAGTWNVPGLTIGVTYYARFVAVDRNGNAAEPSASSVGIRPEQLVQIDIGPDAIGRQQIINLEVVHAKLGVAAVNSLNVEEISAGLISAGTMSAQIALAGRFYTPATANGNRVEFDAAGLRLYRAGTIVGRWQVADASVLATGQMQTAVTGQRIVMNPNGNQPDSILFYPSFSNAFSSIDAVDWGNGMIAGIRIIGSGGTATANAGMLLIRDQFASLVHGRRDLSYWGTEIWIEQSFARMKSATVDLIIDQRLTPALGPRRVSFINADTSGAPIPSGHLQYMHASDDRPWLWGVNQNCGLKFDNGELAVTSGNSAVFANIKAAGFPTGSSETIKIDVRDTVRLVGGHTSWDVIEGSPTKQFRYWWETPRPERPLNPDGSPMMWQVPKPGKSDGRRRTDREDDGDDMIWVEAEWLTPERPLPVHRFPTAEDLAAIDPTLVIPGDRPEDMSVDLRDMVGVHHDALDKIIKRLREYDALFEELKPNRLSPRPQRGDLVNGVRRQLQSSVESEAKDD